MTLKDLRMLEIGLELYRREEPLKGHCNEIIGFLLQVIRHDIRERVVAGESETDQDSELSTDT